MKKSIYIVLFSSVLLLVGCNPKTMEEVFDHEMKNNKDVDEYKLVEKVEEDNVIIFTSHKEDDDYNKDQPKLALFVKSGDEWLWKKTNVCQLDKWNGNLDGEPYIWCGTITEPRHENVIVGDTEAEMIEMNDGIKRVWYHMSKNRNEEIKVILTDGTEEWLKEVIK
ncbi:hypothetical protein FZC74_01305 [Sutcliffiella horikoshii]|uniref:Lipoprotein n=1 Tax=Sutcliffiella horikoshii TaxID=79883 RepID=A0AA94WX44_9BACI|nr:hypothetical protein FZC74_01305 [Sutcliffiella horikoshii]